MIQPGMSPTGARPATLPNGGHGLHATMLCFITTDAAIDAKVLQVALNEAVAQSFNRITVDGDMSTNDTVLILANGLAGNPEFRVSSSEFQVFQAALGHVCLELAKQIVRDGEGVHRVVTVRVTGAKNVREADAAARAVANSALVKTSWHGGDPNWGRIIDALGYSAAKSACSFTLRNNFLSCDVTGTTWSFPTAARRLARVWSEKSVPESALWTLASVSRG